MTAALVFGSFVGFITSIVGYFFAGLGILAAFGVYIATPLTLVAIVCVVRVFRPRRDHEPRLTFAD